MKENQSILSAVISNNNLSEMKVAVELTKQAGKIGFDWPSIDFVFDKMQEELEELREAMKSGNQKEIIDETGDVLFVACNIARHLNVDPQVALKGTNEKFIERFLQVENLARQRHPEQSKYDLATLDQLWNDVKKNNQ
ncbi:MAG TPA: MazG nucleotide pyrophosphohydrolase domain-containing protein [Gammaproteobacteria bacterium]|nr:hypothetical protein [Xanthomonadales bacterium]HOP22928.1 MazG nucleotide pyrophosphohydrolase domain-containing protein [Gammaproteobacteria bacterium]HPI96151.1 MazG nucleotide pyrophosphohydrolase domain-containing protein [Gammaproteobacteria bacterium]HPQ86191.1 MazG nucleotide pyrophosphohydrolase domain-containing protein [Gammaproteobacteria bacterium]